VWRASLPRGPVWEDPNFARLLWTKQGRLPTDERDALRRALLAQLRAADVEIEVAYV
jgi:hypothetical protein